MAYFRNNIEELAGYIPGFQPDQTDVVKLNTNENPYPPSPKVLDAVHTITSESLRRYPAPLGDKFRLAAAEVLGIPSDHILCTNGGDDLLTICFRAFCDEDRPAAYPTPTYSLYPVLAALQDSPVIEIPYEKPDWLDRLAQASAPLTVVCNPNAPTGAHVPAEKLAQLAGQVEGILLIDEAYVDFAEETCLELARDFENVILLRSLSKGYSLAGIRFG
ncbi:MAG: aminotransferase class I/II-fold pyridoxal phosphate-dependent enzyme, partial [Sedimentisphaerales bacterium]|nr:aminotransferase class I/II-fold pyridoxal phosphate-dependent enzyme [Sedimentisphaerales bacterium]